MNIEKTKAKLKTLSDSEVDVLLELVQLEKSTRFTFQSNKTHTPNEMCRSLSNFFAEAARQTP